MICTTCAPTASCASSLPHGVLFRGGEEGAIRKNLVENRHIQAIIGLPANIFFGTGIPTIIMVLRKQRETSDVLVVDASKHFVKEGKNNKLRASDIKRIVDAVTANATVDKFSRLVPIDEIRANDYNLNIPRYVDSSAAVESWDVYATMFGGVPKAEVDALERYWKVWPSLKGQLYRDADGSCLAPATDDVAQVAKENADVCAFLGDYRDAISHLPATLRSRLVDGADEVDTVAEEEAIAALLKDALAGTALIDGYDAYQALDDAWVRISGDLEVIQTEGKGAVRKVGPNMVVKKKNGKDVEVQDGWAGRILPFALVQEQLLAEDVKKITSRDSRLGEISQEVDEILESFDEEDKGSSAAVNDEGSFVTAELKKAVKAIGKHPENDFEQGLVRAQALLDEEKSLKKANKEARMALEETTKEAIEGLTDAQCDDLLAAKWIEPLQVELLALPEAILSDFIAKVSALNAKYATTYSDVCNQIDDAESQLADMLGQLRGNEYDMAGIAELRKLLGGE